MIGTVLCSDIEDYANVLRSGPLLGRARKGALPPSVVGRYLASIHYLLQYTPVHLRLAAELARARGETPIAEYYEQKFEEEASHHKWAESDRDVLFSRFGVEAVQEPAAAMRAMVSTTRAQIEAAPASYLAYILFAEYFTVILGPEWVAALERNCGVPSGALTSVSRHVELDKHHVAEGREVIERLASDGTLDDVLRSTLKETMTAFSAFCDELCQAA
ncbi:MAG TPA: hypothetical protein VHE30_17050 [Polyangiaceae bacterium]|nr:hypothetical protein [Polyangiaceae bacterium]